MLVTPNRKNVSCYEPLTRKTDPWVRAKQWKGGTRFGTLNVASMQRLGSLKICRTWDVVYGLDRSGSG